MPKLILTINPRELDALVKMALDELRNPRDQAHFLLRQKLNEKGFLGIAPNSNAQRLGISQLIDEEESHD